MGVRGLGIEGDTFRSRPLSPQKNISSPRDDGLIYNNILDPGGSVFEYKYSNLWG